MATDLGVDHRRFRKILRRSSVPYQVGLCVTRNYLYLTRDLLVWYQFVNFHIFAAMITTMPEKTHHGKAVKRIREILHIKQEVIADALGISQQSVSTLETKETIDSETLELIAKTLKIPADAIRNFNEDASIFNIQNNYDNSNPNYSFNNYCSFNPLDKYVEAVEKIEKLYEELLKGEREKNALLERLLNQKK